jgi:hypothetical protein
LARIISEATFLTNKGFILYNKGDLDNALKFLNNALDIIKCNNLRLYHERDNIQKTIDLINEKNLKNG